MQVDYGFLYHIDGETRAQSPGNYASKSQRAAQVYLTAQLVLLTACSDAYTASVGGLWGICRGTVSPSFSHGRAVDVLGESTLCWPMASIIEPLASYDHGHKMPTAPSSEPPNTSYISIHSPSLISALPAM